jgi:hypothetical protein
LIRSVVALIADVQSRTWRTFTSSTTTKLVSQGLPDLLGRRDDVLSHHGIRRRALSASAAILPVDAANEFARLRAYNTDRSTLRLTVVAANSFDTQNSIDTARLQGREAPWRQDLDFVQIHPDEKIGRLLRVNDFKAGSKEFRANGIGEDATAWSERKAIDFVNERWELNRSADLRPRTSDHGDECQQRNTERATSAGRVHVWPSHQITPVRPASVKSRGAHAFIGRHA